MGLFFSSKNKKSFLNVFSVAVLVLSIFLALLPSNVLAVTKVSQMTPNDAAKAFVYYKALRTCLTEGTLKNAFSFGFADANSMSDENAVDYEWFNANSPATDVGVYGDPRTGGDGQYECTDEQGRQFISDLVELTGYSSGPDFLCAIGFTREKNPDNCTEIVANTDNDFIGPENKGSVLDNWWQEVIGATSLNAGGIGPGQYILYYESFLEGCSPTRVGSGPIRIQTPSTNGQTLSETRFAYADRDTSNSTSVRLYSQQTITCGELISRLQDDSNAVINFELWLRSSPDNNYDSEVGTGSNIDESSPTTCAVEGTGWIVCTVSRTLAQAMDGVYSLLVNFLEVPALNVDTGDENNFVYRIWEQMRNIANVAFIIAFLIIIFSQITSMGVSNYGVKKLLPRLVIAAILVNTSFWVTAILVDISNITGAGIYSIIQSITNGGGQVGADVAVWETVIAGLLGGGAVVATAAGGVAVITAASGAAVVSAALWAALPALLSVLLAAVIAFAVLAARQGLIIILIILSPLAFVAFLLPNTENLFNIWRKSMTTMLVFYPIFSIIFAGSQLAGLAIISSTAPPSPVPADYVPSDGSMALLILGLFVQVAPLIITPLLIRFSGGVVGQLAGAINNRNKGLIDRSKRIAERKRGLAIGETLGSRSALKNRFTRGTAGVLRKMYRGTQNSALRDKDRQSAIDAENGAAYAEGGRPQDLYNRIQNAGERTKIADTSTETNRLGSAEARQLGVDLHNANVDSAEIKAERAVLEKGQESSAAIYRTQVSKNAVDALEARDKSTYQESLSSSQPVSPTNPLATAINSARDIEQELKVNRDRLSSAESVLQQEYADNLQTSVSLASRAGGIDPRGVARVRARSAQMIDDAHSKAVAAESVMLKQNRAAPSDLVTKVMQEIDVPTGQIPNQERMEAMIQYVVKNGTAEDAIKLSNVLADPKFSTDPSSPHAEVKAELLQSFGEALAPSGKLKSIGGASFGQLAVGNQISGFNDQVLSTIQQKKFKPETFATMDIDEMKAIYNYLQTGATTSLPPDVKASFSDAIEQRITDPRLTGTLSDRDKDILRKIQGSI